MFAGRQIQAGELVEECHVILIDAPFHALPMEVRRIVFNWSVLCGAGPANAIALGHGSLFNHDNPANMAYEADPIRQVLRFFAVRNIDEGEELTVNYNAAGGASTEHADDWFNRMQVTRITG